MLTKEFFQKINSLHKKQPWLSKKSDALISLITTDCKSIEQQELLICLLSRFEFFNLKKTNNALNNIIKDITKNNIFSQSNTIIVSVTMDRYADSGQWVLYEMKRILPEYGWHDIRLINSASKARDTIKNDKNLKNIIYVDEFIGSGKTIEGRVENTQRFLSELDRSDVEIFTYVISASKIGINYLKERDIKIDCKHIIPCGISDYYHDSRDEKISTMKEIEMILLKKYNNKELPSCGYGEVEALYARENGNCPNNVFPIFWWAFYQNGEARPTILTRKMGDA